LGQKTLQFQRRTLFRVPDFGSRLYRYLTFFTDIRLATDLHTPKFAYVFADILTKYFG